MTPHSETLMSEISREKLFGKLNSLGYKTIEAATVFCKMRGNPYVELVHWVHQILQQQDSDLHSIIRSFDLDPSRLAADLTEALDRLPRGSTSIQDLSPHLDRAVERAWVYGSLMFGDTKIRTGHLLVGLLKTQELMHQLRGMSKQFDRILLEELVRRFDRVLGDSPEARLAESAATGGAAPAGASAR
jgi:type VI secretion system protein VasG